MKTEHRIFGVPSWTDNNVHSHVTRLTVTGGWAGNKAAMWWTADPHTWVQIPLRPLPITEASVYGDRYKKTNDSSNDMYRIFFGVKYTPSHR